MLARIRLVGCISVLCIVCFMLALGASRNNALAYPCTKLYQSEPRPTQTQAATPATVGTDWGPVPAVMFMPMIAKLGTGVMHDADWPIAVEELKIKYGFRYPMKQKSWDVHRMSKIIDNVVSKGPDGKPLRQPRVVDLGGGCSNFLNLLTIMGYAGHKNLFSSDLGPKRPSTLTHETPTRRETPSGRSMACKNRVSESDSVTISYQDMMSTSYPTGFFDFIVSVSVVEHGVNLPRFLREANRVLRPGGLLMVSFDYFPFTEAWAKMIAAKKEAFGVPFTAFGPGQASEMFSNEFATRFGFEVVLGNDASIEDEMRFTKKEHLPIYWLSENYTFAMFSYAKVRDMPRIFVDEVITDGTPTVGQQLQIDHIRQQSPNAQVFALVRLQSEKPAFDTPSCMLSIPGVDHISCTTKEVTNVSRREYEKRLRAY